MKFFIGIPSLDDRSRLIRTCGRIFAAHNHYLAEHKRYDEQKYDEQAYRTLLAQYVHLLRKAAEENWYPFFCRQNLKMCDGDFLVATLSPTITFGSF